MFDDQFDFNNHLITNLSKIERLYGRLEGLTVPKKLLLNLERENLIQSSYVSNSIEGNPLTRNEVTNLLLDDRVPANRDEKEVKNYYKILTNLNKYKDQKISLEIIQEIHKQLMTGVEDEIAGKIRDKKIVIGKHVPKKEMLKLKIKHEPPYHKRKLINQALGELINWASKTDMHPVLKAGLFHHHFVFIHPFKDGNGRVCRLITTLLLLKEEYKVNKYFILDDYYDIDRERYSDKLHCADYNKKTEWLEYFTDGIKFSLQSALAKIEQGLDNIDIETRPTKKQKQVLDIIKRKKQITSQELAKILNISRQQAHNLLSSLVEKGFLNKKGKTKGSYYTFQ